MLNHNTKCNIVLGILLCITLTSCNECGGDEPTPDTRKVYANWVFHAGSYRNRYATYAPCTYINGFLESDCDDNNKMFVGMSAPISAGVTKVPILTYGTPLPANTISLDISEGVGVDWLSLGGDTAKIITDTKDGSRYIKLDYVQVVKATSSGPSTTRDTVSGWIYLP